MKPPTLRPAAAADVEDPVGAFRGGGEAQQELRAKVVDGEGVAREALEVGDATEGLDRRSCRAREAHSVAMRMDVGVACPGAARGGE